MVVKALIVAFLMAFGEVVNGNIRVRILHAKFGKERAKRLSFVSGLSIIYLICWFTLPWVAPKSYEDCLMIGALWFFVMLCLDIYFARYIFRLGWSKIADDFNPAKGNLLGVGMVLLLLAPVVVFTLQSQP
ncbi:MAG: hypothetical protein IE916_07545 [Epsilonproteobacteria bacterium]|nr:hypothetical protein [Campylobacterota bacterium]